MIAIPLDAITEPDLRALIDAGAQESRRLEFKQALPDSSDGGKVKFLRSVTAMANTQGGDIIYGVAEAEGVAHDLLPLQLVSQDQVRQRLESLCADGVEPRLTGLVQYRFVPLASGGEVLVVRVTNSWNGPHRVTTGGHAHFYGRNASGTYQLDVGQLREAFTLSQAVAERIRAFRADRLLKIGTDQVPVSLMNGARVILHIVPLQAATNVATIDLSAQTRRIRETRPPGASGWNHKLNLDGVLTYADMGDGAAEGYMLCFREGMLEAVQVWGDFNGDKLFPSLAYEKDLLEALRTYFPLLQEIGLGTPAYLFLTLTNIADYQFAVDHHRFMGPYHRTDRDALILPEVLIEDWSADASVSMRPLFDMVWNAFGYERSFNYDETGKWHPR